MEKYNEFYKELIDYSTERGVDRQRLHQSYEWSTKREPLVGYLSDG